MLINEVINYCPVIFQSLIKFWPSAQVTVLTRLFITHNCVTCVSNENIFA